MGSEVAKPMNIEDFVREVLQQVTSGALTASSQDYHFELDSESSKGVHFNIAVINMEKDEQSNASKAGVGIKVVDASYLKESAKSSSSESISRVEFNIKHRNLNTEKQNDAIMRKL